MQFRLTTRPTPIEEAFAHALRLRLKEEPDCCFNQNLDTTAKPITIVNETTGQQLTFHSVYAASRYIGLRVGKILPHMKKIRGWRILR
jgi:hypothetical protein